MDAVVSFCSGLPLHQFIALSEITACLLDKSLFLECELCDNIKSKTLDVMFFYNAKLGLS